MSIEQAKQRSNSPVIDHITMWDKDNFVNFSDSDSMTDYSHSYSLGINHIIDWLTVTKTTKVDGTEDYMAQPGEVIRMSCGNGELKDKYIKRVERLAKVLGYKIKVVHKKGIYRQHEGNDYYSKARCFFICPYDHKEFYIYDPNLVKESEIITN